MPRTIPLDMLLDLQRGGTTLCMLLRVDPVQPGFEPYFVTSLDQDVVYDDGDGEQTYLAKIALVPSTQISESNLSVDGGDVSSLLPLYDTPISEADIVAGAYDFASFTAYLVDYTQLTPGRHIILSHGTTGRNTITDGGLAFLEELRGLSQTLLQSLTEKWSLGCRATFGSQPGGPDRFPCNFDAEALWEPGTVEGVGLETNREFTTSGLTPEFGGKPGMVRWITGANAGREYEVEDYENDSGGITIGLTFPTMFPMQVGDTFEFRDDCEKTKAACLERDNYPNYRGEPDIPVADAGQIAAPGASAGIGTGATVTTEYQE